MTGRAWLVSGAIAVVVAIAAWWLTRSSGGSVAEREPATAVERRAGSQANPMEPVPPRPPTRVARIPVAERLEMASRIEAARARRAAAAEMRPSEPPTTSETGAGQMDTAEQILEQLQGISTVVRAATDECKRKYAPGVAGFKTQLKLVGDPDIGTLIDASTPVVDGDGAALPAAFDDCVRAEFQALALPPIKTGDRWDVTYSVGL